MNLLQWECYNCGGDNLVDNVNGMSIEVCKWCGNLHQVVVQNEEVVNVEEI